MARMSSSRIIRYSSPSILTSVPEYLPMRTLSPTLTSKPTRSPSSMRPGTGGDDLGFLGLFLGRVRDDDSADLLLFGLVETLD